MTINEAMSAAKDFLQGYEYTDTQAFKWLNECEQHVWEDVLKHYDIEGMERPPAYDLNTDGNMVLSVPEPYSMLYVHYIAAQHYYWNREYTGYANAREQYNGLLNDFAGKVTREHKHKANPNYKFRGVKW